MHARSIPFGPRFSWQAVLPFAGHKTEFYQRKRALVKSRHSQACDFDPFRNSTDLKIAKGS
jgi:hypothetical protein